MSTLSRHTSKSTVNLKLLTTAFFLIARFVSIMFCRCIVVPLPRINLLFHWLSYTSHYFRCLNFAEGFSVFLQRYWVENIKTVLGKVSVEQIRVTLLEFSTTLSIFRLNQEWERKDSLKRPDVLLLPVGDKDPKNY